MQAADRLKISPTYLFAFKFEQAPLRLAAMVSGKEDKPVTCPTEAWEAIYGEQTEQEKVQKLDESTSR